MPRFDKPGLPVATDSPLAAAYYGQGTIDKIRAGTPSANPADIMAGVANFTPGMPIPFGNFDQAQVNNFLWANPGSFRVGNTGTVIGNNATGGGGQLDQNALSAMISQLMDPYLKQIQDYQTKITDLYQNRQQPGGPFGFMNAPMTFNKPVMNPQGQREFRRVSYGAPENRGFNPGGYPQFNAPGVPSMTPGMGGMFSDPFLLKLAETLFPGGPSWMPKTPAAPASSPAPTTAQNVPFSLFTGMNWPTIGGR